MATVESFEWTEAVVSELIQERPCLYNTKSPNYFNRDRKNKALDEISKTLGTTGDAFIC